MITAIILTYNEEKHIARCIRSLLSVAERIVLVDSYSQDCTLEIARELGAEILQRRWPNNHSQQFNWGLSAANISSPWTLRIDADEYLSIELQEELKVRVKQASEDISGLLLPRLVYFQGHAIRHGGFYPQWLLRVWRTNMGRSESRLMDEHIVVSGGRIEKLNHDLIDENLNNITWWTQKHLGYARREAAAVILDELTEEKNRSVSGAGAQAARKRWLKKNIYGKLPLGARSLAYFGYRFGLRLGVLDHPKIWTFHLLQGLWYRLLVDINLQEYKSSVGSSPREEQLKYLQVEWGVDTSEY